MKTLLTLSCILSILLPNISLAVESAQFVNRVGEFSIPDSPEKIKIIAENDWIQFRIRGTGPSKPLIPKTSDWFIYTVDKNHFWVYAGDHRLFYYSWKSDAHSRVDEWTYPRLGDVKLPKRVEEQIKK